MIPAALDASRRVERVRPPGPNTTPNTKARQLKRFKNGAKRIRTADPLHAMQVLYQLSYGPMMKIGSKNIWWSSA